jgi:hypothetical protein
MSATIWGVLFIAVPLPVSMGTACLIDCIVSIVSIHLGEFVTSCAGIMQWAELCRFFQCRDIDPPESIDRLNPPFGRRSAEASRVNEAEAHGAKRCHVKTLALRRDHWHAPCNSSGDEAHIAPDGYGAGP